MKRWSPEPDEAGALEAITRGYVEQSGPGYARRILDRVQAGWVIVADRDEDGNIEVILEPPRTGRAGRPAKRLPLMKTHVAAIELLMARRVTGD